MPQDNRQKTNVRRRIAHIMGHFGYTDALTWPETHLLPLDALQLVELSLHIEAEFDIDFRDDLIPSTPTMGDVVDMVDFATQHQDRRKISIYQQQRDAV